MRRRTLLLGGLFSVPVAAGFYAWPTATRAMALQPALTEAEAAAVRAAVNPAKGEDLFDEIPWQTSLWDARVLAAKEGKPILLWEMDGHPLGCG